MDERKTPKILWKATRQYCHNNGKGLVMGFDGDETVKIVYSLQDRIKELEGFVIYLAEDSDSHEMDCRIVEYLKLLTPKR